MKKNATFNQYFTVFYSPSIEGLSMALSCIVSEIVLVLFVLFEPINWWWWSWWW